MIQERLSNYPGSHADANGGAVLRASGVQDVGVTMMAWMWPSSSRVVLAAVLTHHDQ